MTIEQKQVKEFMQVFGQQTPEKPCIPSLEVRKLRAKLILEEALETIMKGLSLYIYITRSVDEDDPVEMDYIGFSDNTYREGNRPSLIELADGLADLHYVGYCGTAIACGLDMEPIFAEVHRSNMSKMWTKEEYNKSLNGSSFLYSLVDDLSNVGKFPVYNKDGKVIKSPSYSPANLQPIIDAQMK